MAILHGDSVTLSRNKHLDRVVRNIGIVANVMNRVLSSGILSSSTTMDLAPMVQNELKQVIAIGWLPVICRSKLKH